MKKQKPEAQFRYNLDTCIKNNDLDGALALYNSAAVNLTSYHYNALLHLLSSSSQSKVIDYSFEIFNKMISSGIKPNEATVTNVARIAATKSGEYAFDFIKRMKSEYNVTLKLRTFAPVINAFCNDFEAEKAYEVEHFMADLGISPEEVEVTALLRVSSKKGLGEKAYEYLLKLRNCVNSVKPETVEILEEWFKSDKACEVCCENWDADKVKEVMVMHGGGWHGTGWLGKGKWEVKKGNVSSNGECSCCRKRLACVDVEVKEVENFAESVASLAMERERHSNFKNFQEWLNNHADYEAIVDGANVALYKQNFAEGGFNLSQLDTVVRELNAMRGTWPLVILHNKRYRMLMEDPSNRQLLETWKAKGVLFTTPNGSNDDWYWLYAAVQLKCLLVTNDEMRDHIFEILGRSFFPKWKERHQVRYTFVKGKLTLAMPPPYSVVIQESALGSWHIPIDDKSNEENTRTWLCVTRSESFGNCEANANGKLEISAEELHTVDKSSSFDNMNSNDGYITSRKRKERSPSPSKAVAS